MQAAQRHGVPLAGWTSTAFASRPAQRTRSEERALFVAGLRALRGQHAGRATQRVQRPHARAPTPTAPPHHLNLAGTTRTARHSLTPSVRRAPHTHASSATTRINLTLVRRGSGCTSDDPSIGTCEPTLITYLIYSN